MRGNERTQGRTNLPVTDGDRWRKVVMDCGYRMDIPPHSDQPGGEASTEAGGEGNRLFLVAVEVDTTRDSRASSLT